MRVIKLVTNSTSYSDQNFDTTSYNFTDLFWCLKTNRKITELPPPPPPGTLLSAATTSIYKQLTRSINS